MSTPLEYAVTTSAAPARGLVISGAIITVVSLIVTAVAVVYFVTGLISSPEAMSMVFPFLLLFWLALATPTWLLGIGLLGAGRQQQRGPVRGHVVAWILALGGLPFVGFLLATVIGAAGTGVGSLLFGALVVGIPVAIVVMIAAGAWLVWGRPAKS